MICRVFVNGDSSVRVVHPAPQARLEGESDVMFYARTFALAVEGDPTLVGLSYFDVDAADLPARTLPCNDALCDQRHSVRNTWRATGSAFPKIAPDIQAANPHKDLDHLLRKLDAELDKAAPDPVTVLKLDRERRKLVHEATR